jgi:hypothetical protein
MRIAALALAVSAACGSDPARPPSQPAVVEAPPVLAPAGAPGPVAMASTNPDVVARNHRAADTSLDRDARCAAVFELFDKYVAPGATAPAVASVITERDWIVVDDPITAIGGEVPIDVNWDDSMFVVHCLATPNPQINNMLWSPWVIYGRSSGTSTKTLRPFLAAGASVTLIEYALVYPDGRIEQYRPAGRRSLHM